MNCPLSFFFLSLLLLLFAVGDLLGQDLLDAADDNDLADMADPTLFPVLIAHFCTSVTGESNLDGRGGGDPEKGLLLLEVAKMAALEALPLLCWARIRCRPPPPQAFEKREDESLDLRSREEEEEEGHHNHGTALGERERERGKPMGKEPHFLSLSSPGSNGISANRDPLPADASNEGAF